MDLSSPPGVPGSVRAPSSPPRQRPSAPRWNLARPRPEAVSEVARSAGLPEVVARLLVNRGLERGSAVEAHLHPELTALHDPSLLPGMEAATERLLRAIADREPVLVHGDYDVDGVTGTALLVRLLRRLGAQVHWHIPNRFEHGYSFGQHSLDRAEEVGARVVISVDNGTSARDTIAALLERGVETIVTDHHEPPLGELPPAVAIVNPKLHGSPYPFRELCGGAVAFKLAWGLCQKVSGAQRVRSDLRDFLVEAMAYVAIATVCDVVPLVDENRVLARFGLRSLRQARTPGLAALLRLAGLADRRLAADDVGFQVGPRINASGRLGSAATAVELLLTDDPREATALARRLDELNQERRRIEQELGVEARRAARAQADPERHPVLVVAGQGWHQGVIGIVAARLVGEYDRPALVIGLDGEEGRGSARSVPGLDLLEVMHGGAEHFLRYGGHAQAAGCEVRADAVDALREALCERARQVLAGSPLPPRELAVDAELELGEMTEELMRHLERLEPFGEQNPAPVLVSRDLRLAEPPRRIGRDEDHLLLQVRRGDRVLKALGFGLGARAEELAMGVPVDVAYTPCWNTFRGVTALELRVLDFQVRG